LIGKKSDIFLIDHYNKQICSDVWRSFTEGITWRGQYRKKRKKGAYADLVITSYPIKDANGTITGYTVIERDITRESKLQKQIQQKHKMEALGTLSGGVAHDFSNILMPIIVNTEMALLDMPEDSPVRDYLESSLNAAKRGKGLVHQIISFSRSTSQEKEPIKISSVIREALRLLNSTLPSNIKIKQHIRSESGVVLGNPSQIYQLFINLCSNAADAMEKTGGALRVGLEIVLLNDNRREEKFDLKTKDFIKLTVSDTGCGMNEEVIDRIFDPFFSTKEKGKRTGMGLSVVHGIVKNHGGFIDVQSEEGEGTVFEVFLPLAKSEFKEAKKEIAELPRGNERVLVVDDDETVLQSLQKVLERLGYQVITQKDGKTALKIFSTRPESFDLIIADQIMPEILGSDLSKEVLSIRPDVPIILCTGYDDKIDKEKVKDIGIREFLLKPVDIHEIAQIVRHVLDK
jgi:signal transduction histidine kinase